MNSTRQAALTPPSRIAWIDVCKGIGIALVVLGHVAPDTGLLHNSIYIFHMPLFFFLSGYLRSAKPNFGNYFEKKSINLLLPYLAFLLLLFPVAVIGFLHQPGLISRVIHLAYNSAWGGTKLSGVHSTFWFISCLFMTQQIMNFLIVKTRLPIVILISVLCLLVSYFVAFNYPSLDLPLDINVVLAAIPIFCLGYLSKNLPLNSPWLAVFAFSGAVCAFILVWRGVGVEVDMKAGNYGIPFLSFVLGYCCVLSLIYLSRIVALIPFLSGILASAGTYSMGIMFIHSTPRILCSYLHFSLVMNFAVSLTTSYLFSYIISRFRVTQALLLGWATDLNELRSIICQS